VNFFVEDVVVGWDVAADAEMDVAVVDVVEEDAEQGVAAEDAETDAVEKDEMDVADVVEDAEHAAVTDAAAADVAGDVVGVEKDGVG
jgi:hypothetical protein